MTPSLPYHHRRTEGVPLIPGQQLIIGPPGAVSDNLRRAVVDTRRAVDWLATCPDIDQHAISIAGVSLGGIVASLAFKVEPRFANGVFVVGGSGVGDILEHGRTDVLDIFRAAARANVVNPQDFIDALQIADPINVPDFVPRPALLMNGLSDIIMVLDNALRFRESMCLAEQIWTTGGHYFPMYAAEYLLIDYIAGQYAASPAFSRVPNALACPESVPVSLSVFGDMQSFEGPGKEEAVGSWLARATAVSKLKTIPWFPDYPHDNPRWATENPTIVKGED